jgi:AraC family transcriptional regulator
MVTDQLSASLREDRINGPAAWAIEADDHLLILHEGGAYVGLETALDGALTSVGEPVPGEAWLVPAGHRYTGRAREGKVRYIAVTIPAGQLHWTSRSPALAGLASPVLAATVRGVLAAEDGAEHALCSMLVSWTERTPNCAVSAEVRGRIGQLVKFINRHLESPLPVAVLADEYGTSVNTLITHFTSAMGRTPGQYVLAQRLRRACSLLTDNSLTITDAALSAGFASHQHLCTAFREKFGSTPGAWRRQHSKTRF